MSHYVGLSTLEQKSDYKIVATYESVRLRPQDFDNEVIEVVVNLLNVTGRWPELFEFRRTLIRHYLKAKDNIRLAINILGLASLLVEQGYLEKALQVLSVFPNRLGHNKSFGSFKSICVLNQWPNGKREILIRQCSR